MKVTGKIVYDIWVIIAPCKEYNFAKDVNLHDVDLMLEHISNNGFTNMDTNQFIEPENIVAIKTKRRLINA